MQLRCGLTLALSVIALTGCNSLAFNNGTLDYKATTNVEPLKYPEGAMVRPATPLYPAPVVDPLAIQHAPRMENEKGNRFELPRLRITEETATAPNVALSRPSLIQDGNQNPLLKIDGNSATIWQYTLATLSSLNHTVIAQSKDRYEVSVRLEQQSYLLRLVSVGTSKHLAVFNADNSPADQTVAADLLTQIYQNWPA
jgi:uncharacterized lipoprotein